MEQENKYCVFCCRELTRDTGNEAKNIYNSSQVNHFFKLFSRYCSNSLKKSSSYQYNCCDNCVVVVNDFIDLYIHLETLQLKLKWRIETLKTIMEQADKVPSRQNAFGPVTKPNGGTDSSDETRKLRNQFITQCSTHLKASWPKVKLSHDHISSTNCDISMPFIMDQNQTNIEIISPNIELATPNETSNGTAFTQLDTIEDNTNFMALHNIQDINLVVPENTDFTSITEEDELSVEDNQYDANTTQIGSECLVKSESLTAEVLITETIVSSDFDKPILQCKNSTEETNPDILPITFTSPCEETDIDRHHDNPENSLDTSTFEYKDLFIREHCPTEENSVEVGNLYSSHQNTTNEIDESELMQCVLGEQVSNESMNIPLIDSDIGVFEHAGAINYQPGHQYHNCVKEKRRLREIFQCKLCKLTFSTSDRLKCHAKSHEDDIDDSSSSEDDQSSTSETNGFSSSDSESDLDCKTKRKRHVQCSKCTKFFGKGNDIKQHMKMAHSSENINVNSTFTGNSKSTVDDDESNSVNPIAVSKPNLPIFEEKSIITENLTSMKNDDGKKSKTSVEDSDSSYVESSISSLESDEDCVSDLDTLSNIKQDFEKLAANEQVKTSRNCEETNKESISSIATLQTKKKPRSAESTEHKQVQCPHCPKRFLNSHTKQLHIWKKHTNNLNSPNIEDVIVMDNFTINDIIHKENAKYLCKIQKCTQKFLTEETLNDHSKLHGEFTCKFCTEIFQFAPQLALHENKSHNKYVDRSSSKSYMCTRCPYKSQEEHKFVNHFLQTHFNLLMDSHRCLICKSPFQANRVGRSMLAHHLTHHEISNASSPEKVHRCEDCPAYFLTVFQLSKHKILFHATGVKKHTCADCGNKFLLLEQLRSHRRKVHKDIVGELEYSCTVEGCERRFETKYELDSHNLHRHTGNDPILMCTECGKRFNGKAALRRHQQVHDDKFQETRRKEKEVGFVCEQCGKKFKGKEKLQVHYKSHSGPESWNFCCEICSKKCLTGGKLREHMRVHTKEKPFVCDVCGQKYAHRHNWRLHLKSKHGQS